MDDDETTEQAQTRTADPAPQTVAVPGASSPAPDAETIRSEERARVSAIMTLCARHGLDAGFSGDLIGRGVTLDAARAAVLDALVANDPAGRIAEPAPAQARDSGANGATYRDAITRQTLINDDLDAFTRIPASFGASAADLESDITYAILMQNPAMADGTALFHATHGNLGTASAITETALASAYRGFAQQKGIEARLISALPRMILVPPGPRAVEARKQVTATTPGSTAEVNTFAGRLEVIEEPRLIPASGQDPWFLAADPARIDTVEYAYLDGQESVFTETRSGFEVDGIEIKARHDFAAKAIDWRGLYKNPGAAA